MSVGCSASGYMALPVSVTPAKAQPNFEGNSLVVRKPSIPCKQSCHRETQKLLQDYGREILKHAIIREEITKPTSYVHGFQKDIQVSHRTVVVEWIVELAEALRVERAIPDLAINLLDRYLSVYKIARSVFQLLAAACFSIAAKQDETDVIGVSFRTLMRCLPPCYSAKDLARMELHVLVTLGWRLTTTTPAQYVDLLFGLIAVEDAVSLKPLTDLMIDIVQRHETALLFRSSTIAFASVLCAFDILQRTPESSLWLNSWLEQMPFLRERLRDILHCQEQVYSLFVTEYPCYADTACRKQDVSSPTSVMQRACVSVDSSNCV